MNDRPGKTNCGSLAHPPATAMLFLGLLTALFSATVESSQAAEIRLRHQCQSDGVIVTLGDVADILTADQQQVATLSAIELCATPVTGQRFVRLREIQDRLLAHGINLLEHRFSGAGQVTVCRAAASHGQQERRLPSSVTRKANERAAEAVAAYLQKNVSAAQPWNVEAQLTVAQAELVSDPDVTLSILPTPRPQNHRWIGPQRFRFCVQTLEGPQTFPVDTHVTHPPMVIVATTSLSRGTVIGPANVEIRAATALEQTADAFESLEEVIGKETKYSIPRGKILEHKMVRSPLLVRRGELVTVHVRTSGIQIRTTARAKDDGALGDLITVESPLDRKAYFARVAAPQEVEVYARSVRAEPTVARHAAMPFRK